MIFDFRSLFFGLVSGGLILKREILDSGTIGAMNLLESFFGRVFFGIQDLKFTMEKKKKTSSLLCFRDLGNDIGGYAR